MDSSLGPGLLFFLLQWIIPIVIGYVVIRLAVRHGVIDAHRKMAEPAESRHY